MISPLISITDQEVKNAFYRENVDNKTLAFKYSLVDFSLGQKLVSKDMLKHFKSVLQSYQSNGILPKEFAKIETNVLGDITEGGLNISMKDLLKRTDEGAFSDALLMDNNYHVFFVKKKDLVESDVFQNEKEKIRNQLFEKDSRNMIDQWYSREKEKHYIRYFL